MTKNYVPVDPELKKRNHEQAVRKQAFLHSKWAAGLSFEDIPLPGSARHRIAINAWRGSKAPLKWYEQHAMFGCELCGVQGLPLVIDHDHACCRKGLSSRCGKCNRGVLCNRCNVRLGHYENGSPNHDADLVWIRQAQMYLQPGYQTLFYFLALQE